MKAGKDLRHLTRKQFLRELVDLGAHQRAMIEARVTGFAIDAAATAMRRRRVKWDYRFFCETYFPHFINAAVEPSKFQLHCYRLVPAMMLKPGAKSADVGPRGEGKSTLLVQLQHLWRVVNGYNHYQMIIMDAKEQSEMMLDAIKAELEVNARLRQDFPEVCGQGPLWRTTKIVTASGVMLEAVGASKRIRGRRFGAYRPDFATLDDFENDENVKSKEWRDKRERLLRRSINNLGPPDGSLSLCYVGTLLDLDSVLARTLKNPMWKAHAYVFPSIIRWPDRMDLWDQWETILLGESEDDADAFFQKHRREMLAGHEVSWPGMRPLLALMKLRAEDHKAFDTEHQHNPLDPGEHPFYGCLKYWVFVRRAWQHYGAHDPSMGKHSRRGDPAATLVGAIERGVGKLHVVEALIARRAPDKQISDVIRLQEEYHCLLWGVESVAFQEFFRMELVKRSAAKKVPVPARGVGGSGRDKDLVIEALQPHVDNGLILFGRNQRTLISQLEQWPSADHDDGPDTLEMLWQIATKGLRGGAGTIRTGARRSGSIDLRGHPS